MFGEYAGLSQRTSFNRSLNHLRTVNALRKSVEAGANLAEEIDGLEKGKNIHKGQIGPLLSVLLMDTLEYRAYSFNLPLDCGDFGGVADRMRRWNRVDLVLAYHHPQLGITLLNPKCESHWDSIEEFAREELLVIYALSRPQADDKFYRRLFQTVQDLICGVIVPEAETHMFCLPREQPSPPSNSEPPAPSPPRPAVEIVSPVPTEPRTRTVRSVDSPPARTVRSVDSPPATTTAAPAVRSGKRRMTPKYSVQVTNELFHNGNVEAWKNIIESYRLKFSHLEVHVFHDGKKVNNINSLFKWGKVGHGDVLLISVAGDEIGGVARLQRYLFEGASPRYKTFLKKDINKSLQLF